MPITISGIEYNLPLIYLTREEAAPRYEVCGKCGENKGGICTEVNMPIKSFIQSEPSGCPLNYWPALDLERLTIRDFGIKCCL